MSKRMIVIDGKEYDTIVSDLDGTMLGKGNVLPEGTVEAIEALQAQGIRFVAASGRSYHDMQRIFREMCSEPSMICENGTSARTQGELLLRKIVPDELARRVIARLEECPQSDIMITGDDTQFSLHAEDAFLDWVEEAYKTRLIQLSTYDELPCAPTKISIHWAGGIPADAEKMLHETFDAECYVADSGNGWLDFMCPDAGKGTALIELAKAEKFDLARTVCFGDSENDISMFEVCGLSYVMEDAREHVIASGDLICRNVKDTLLSFAK